MTTPGPGDEAVNNLLKSFGIDPSTIQIPASGSQTPIEYVPWLDASRMTSKAIKGAVPENPTQGDRQALIMREAGIGAPLDASDAAIKGYYGDDEPASGGGPILRDAREVMGAIDQMEPKDFAEVAARMVKAGMISENYSRIDVEKAWDGLVDEAVRWHAFNPTDMMTPVDMIELNHGDGSPGSTGKPGPKPESVISKSVSISSNEQARSLLRQMMAAQLGRRPTQTEIDDFQGSLNEAQRNNPTVTTSTRQLNAAGDTTNATSTTTGGMDDSEFAYDAVTNNDPDSEYGKYQQATSYYNAFMQAIRGPGGSG